jgi:hypothetical protein
MNDSRIERNGTKLDFTCKNKRFATDLESGYKHVSGHGYKGSATPGALYNDDEYSLWLEHVVDLRNGHKCYWLMWYKGGLPTIPMSGVLDKEDILEIIPNIKQYI